MSDLKFEYPYTLEEMLEKLRHVLEATERTYSLELLEKAVTKADSDKHFAEEMKMALLQGSTIELRTCMSAFGDYMAMTHAEIPRYRHSDAVDGIDSTMLAIKNDVSNIETLDEYIEFIRLMRR